MSVIYVRDDVTGQFTELPSLQGPKGDTGPTAVKINNVTQDVVNFTSDPQTQINNKADTSAIPTKTSDLTNDGDGTNPFLTEHQSLASYRTSADQDAIDILKQDKSDSSLTTTSKTIVGAINEIDGMIPAQASVENQLGDKNFINSSIATNTAYYISNNGQPFNSVAELEAYSGTVTNNDYAFVTGTDEQGNTYFDRYKATVSGSTVTWAKEYRLNNSSFTAQQWSAITSGITSGLVALINTALQPSALTNYVQKTDYANASTGGVIKANNQYGLGMDNGNLRALIYTYNEYPTANERIFICKNTLENVITGKQLTNQTYVDTADALKVDKLTTSGQSVYGHNGSTQNEIPVTSATGIPIATSISGSSTNNEIPSAKAVYDFVMSLMS